jgi:hypothetical protein
MTVVIAGSTITDVGKTAEVAIPKGARVLDVAGAYLIPGLWDMHVHLFTDGRYNWAFPLLVANGITGIREMGTDLPIERIHHVRQEIASGARVGPRTAWTGRILDGAGTGYPIAAEVSQPVEGRRLVRLYKQQGADFIKVHDLLSRDTYLAIVDEAKREKIPLVGHPPFSATVVEASDLGQHSIEHLKDVLVSASRDESSLRDQVRQVANQPTPNVSRTRAEILAIDSYDANKAASLFTRFVRNGTWHTPTLVNKLTLAEADRASARDSWKYVPRSLQERWLRTWPKAPAVADDHGRSKYVRASADLTAALDRAGVQLLAGTDSPNPYVPGFARQGELELMVEGGMTPLDALRTATINPARFLKKERELGTIEKGKLADLVLLYANPLQNISNVKRIAAVVVNGRLLERTALDALLAGAENAVK